MPLITAGGSWTANEYEPVSLAGKGDGCNMKLHFEPNDKTIGDKIGLIQVLLRRIMRGSNPDAALVDQLAKNQLVAGSKAEARARRSDGIGHLDRLPESNNPIYGAPDLAPGSSLSLTPRGYDNIDAARGRSYHLGKGGKYRLSRKTAKLHDAPVFGAPNNGDEMIFETGAIGLSGSHNGIWYGSVYWGWRKNAGNIAVIAFRVASFGVPTRAMVSIINKWNGSTSSEGVAAIGVPIPNVDLSIPGNDIGTKRDCTQYLLALTEFFGNDNALTKANATFSHDRLLEYSKTL
jgi:hypothetical protein